MLSSMSCTTYTHQKRKAHHKLMKDVVSEAGMHMMTYGPCVAYQKVQGTYLLTACTRT